MQLSAFAIGVEYSFGLTRSSKCCVESNNLSDIDLRAKIAHAITRAAIAANEMSGRLGAWVATPESYLQCAIVPVVSDQHYILLEASTSQLLDWHYENSRRDRSLSSVEGGRIDIAVFDRNPNPDEAHVVGLIEVKKYGQRFGCLSDADRLRALTKHLDTVKSALLVAHLEGDPRDPQRLDSMLKCFLEDAQVTEDRMVVDHFQVEGVPCASAVVELLP